MKKLIQKITDTKLLFYLTAIFIVAALALGLSIDFLFQEGNKRLTIIGIIGLVLVLMILVLLFGYVYRIVVGLRKIYREQGNLWQLYWHDKLFRTAVGDAFGCLFILTNGFINFGLSFASFKWYYLSTSAIFFLIFIMKLYLIFNIGHDEKRQQQVIMWLMLFMSLACAGVVIMLWSNEIGYTARGLLIYWDALYVFASLTAAIVGVVQAIKSRNGIIGRFLAVQLANAIFAMFALTISMIITFGDNLNEIKPLALTVGVVATMLINALAVAQFMVSQKLSLAPSEPSSTPDQTPPVE